MMPWRGITRRENRVLSQVAVDHTAFIEQLAGDRGQDVDEGDWDLRGLTDQYMKWLEWESNFCSIASWIWVDESE